MLGTLDTPSGVLLSYMAEVGDFQCPASWKGYAVALDPGAGDAGGRTFCRSSALTRNSELQSPTDRIQNQKRISMDNILLLKRR